MKKQILVKKWHILITMKIRVGIGRIAKTTNTSQNISASPEELIATMKDLQNASKKSTPNVTRF
jgi:hypothetical protein